MELQTRNATLGDLAALLKSQEASKIDAVIPAQAITSRGGILHVAGTGPDGPIGQPGTFRPTEIMDGQIADKLGVPVGYVRRLRNDRPDLYDANVNGLLHGRTKHTANGPEIIHPADARRFLLRGFTGPDFGLGVGRALLSDTFRIVDHLDVLTAALDGVKETGTDIEVDSCDLTERRMVVKIKAPGIAALAPALLAGYRSPFADENVKRAGQALHQAQAGNVADPIVFAGFVIQNSETGGGAFSITPRLVVKWCNNGAVITTDALRRVHLGSKMDEGIVRWADDTAQKNLELVRLQTRDAVAAFLDVDYVTTVLTRLEETAGVPLGNPAEAVQLVGQKLRYTEEEQAGILDMFIRGGQVTAGGMMQAITAYSQTVENADAAWDLELSALAAMDEAARVSARI